jgi:high-affinity Fe2+/Pb2+ permease|tara:strand:- start:711 stop:1376 length:666 start_codon:yes stop_codon:yes gene_type:complete
MALNDLLPTSLYNSAGFAQFAEIGLAIFYTVMVVGGVMLAFLLLYLYVYVYKYKVVIFKRSGNTSLISQDRGRIKSKDGKSEFKLLFRKKVNVPPPDFKFMNPSLKGNPVLFFYQFSDTEILPLEVELKTSNPHIFLTPIEEDLKHWFILTQRRIHETYNKPDFWAKYGGIVSVFGVMVFVIIALWMTLGKINDVTTGLSSVASSIKTAASEFGKQVISGS